METILVTEPEFLRAEDAFRQTPAFHCQPAPSDENALAQLVLRHRARAVIVGVTPYRGPLYAALGEQGGGMIARFGVGHDSLDKTLARQHGTIITNTPGVLDVSVAEHTLWLMGCLARRVARLDARIRRGDFTGQTGTELRGKCLGIVGLGGIGRRVAAMAHFGFGLRVRACGRRASVEALSECGVESYTDRPEDLFRQSDILSLHLRADAGTRHFINAERLTWLRRDAMLINTARGAIVDEAALFDALAGGRLAGAALDVFEHEPYVPVHPTKDLRTLQNVLLTPHVGSNTHEANLRMAEAALANVIHFVAGRIEQLSRVDHL